MTDKPMTEDERVVREAWVWLQAGWGYQYSARPATFNLSLPIIWRENLNNVGFFLTPEEAWSAAAEFTRNHLREIADVQEEIKWLMERIAPAEGRSIAGKRILAREQAALEASQKGMK